MCPTTLENPTKPEALSKPPKVANVISFTLETTGDWKVVGTPNSRTETGTGAIKLEFTGKRGGNLSINIQSMQVEPIPPRPPKWTIKGDGDLTLSSRTKDGKTSKEQWIGPITCMIDPVIAVTYIGN
jgi:hypothetical protein